MIYQGLLYLGHFYVVILCFTFFESVLQYLNTEISKLHSPDRLFLALYMTLFWSNYWHQRYCIFCFCSLLHTCNTHFSEQYWEVGHPTVENIYECNTEITQDVAYFQ